MIPKYDPLQQSVRLNEARMKGKVDKNVNLQCLAMKLIIEKNKKIASEDKLYKTKVVKARQLRIKISELFNCQIVKINYLFTKRSFNTEPKNSAFITLSNKKNAKILGNFSQKQLLRHQTLQQQKKHQKGLRKKSTYKKQSSQQPGGLINLFQKFTKQELNQIESDYQYFLVKSELIQLFRKYMQKKRLNNKDRSFEKFMLRNSEEYYSLPSQRVSKMPKQQKKQCIIQIIESIPYHEKLKPNLFTNPQSAQSTLGKKNNYRHKSQHSKMPLFVQLKQKQLQNEERIRIQQEKKRRKLRIDICYNDGVAAEIRAMHYDKKKLLLSQKNDLQNRRLKKCRNRIATVNEQYGKTVQLTQEIRKEFIKKRMIKTIATGV